MVKKEFEFKKFLLKNIRVKRKVVPGTYLNSLVKIESATVEIFLIWTNVAWTLITVTVGICCRCSEDPMFKV